MAEGTQVGNVYLDLQVRDTLTRQIQDLAAKAQASAQQCFAAVGKTAGAAMDKGFRSAAQAVRSTVQQSAADTQKAMTGAVNGAFSKTAANLQAKLKMLQKTLNDNEVRLAQIVEDTARGFRGSPWADQATESALQANRAYQTLQKQQEKLETQMAYLRDRLAIEVQAAAAKQAAAEQAAYAKAAQAAENAAKRQQAAARQAHTTAAPPAASRTINTDKAVRTDTIASDASQSAEQTRSIWQRALDAIAAKMKSVLGGGLSSLWRSIKSGASKAGSALAGLAKKMLPFQTGIKQAGTGVQSLAVRLRSIVSGALVFNVISAGLTRMVSAMGTALTSSSQMQAALANLKGAAATAAAPIIQILTPALAALANAAATVFSYLSQLISFFTGKSVSAMASAAKGMHGVGSAAGGAAKEVKKANGELAAFDELNVLNKQQDEEPDASGGGGGGAGAIVPNYDFKGKSPFLDSILDAIKAGQWEEVGKLLAEKLNGAMASIPWEKIDKTVSGWASNLARTLNGFVAALDWPLLGKTVASGLNVGLHAVDTFMDTFDFTALGDGLANGLNGAIATLDWASLGRFITDKIRAVFEILHGFVRSFDFTALGTSLATATMAAINNVDWVQAFGDGSAFIMGALQAMTAWVQGIDWASLGTTIADCLLAIDWGGILLNLVLFIGTTLSSLGEMAASFFTELAQNCGDGFLQGILQFMAGIFDWLKTQFIDPIVNDVKSLLGIHSPSTVFAEIGTNVVLGMLNGITQTWTRITTFFTTALTAVKNTVTEAWNGVLDVTTNIWNSICDAIRSAVNGVIGIVNSMVQGVVDGINGIGKALSGFSFDMPAVLGGGTIGISVPTLTAPQIPMLASGGVIEQPTLAMMGEYTGAGHNPEIAAPQSLLAETVNESIAPLVSALAELIQYLRDGGNQEIVIRFAASGGLGQLVRLLKPYIDKEDNRRGGKLITGGVD